MMWIGLHFPRLPLETLLRGSPSPEAWAVVENERILMTDRKAAARGIREGMLVSAALAMAPQLRTRARDAASETENLLGLAAWAGQFTPSVALELPDGLLLEVSGGLKLFGGLARITEKLRAGLAEMGFDASLACAPTAGAASWLARARMNGFALDGHDEAAETIDECVREALMQALAPLPVELLRASDEVHAGLAAIGVATLGQLLALPRPGVARRFGQPVLDQLDRALGRLGDARSFFTPPPRFQATIDLPSEVAQAEALLFAGRRLLVQLAGFLAARAGGVQRFVLKLAHRDGPATEVEIGLVAPSRDAEHFSMLLRERLGRLTLSEPVRSLTLEAAQISAYAGSAQSLLPEDRTAPGDWQRLIERLRARLGDEAVQAIATAPEHRPHRAQRVVAPGAPRAVESRQLKLEFGERPFWLLESPRPLPEVQSVPHYRGPLTLLAGPERIESGWWDDEDVLRDYFIARTPDEALVWVYRERGRAEGWYLHGLFS